MIARARSIAVVAILVGGALALIGSTQTWLEVSLRAGAAEPLAVPGASALPLLTPLSLAALALGLALTVVGRVLRYVFGALAVVIGGALLLGAGRVGLQQPVDAVAKVVTDATGLSGEAAIADLIASTTVTPWPFVTAFAALLIALGGLFALVTAHRWPRSGRRYQRDALPAAGATAGTNAARPHDANRDSAIDSWDDLSHGSDPTAR